MKKTSLLILFVFCLSAFSIGTNSIPSVDAETETTVQIPDNQWKITGSVKGKGDVKQKFSLRQNTAKILNMGEDMKFELQTKDAQLQFSLQIPVKGNVKKAELYQYQEQPASGEEAGFYRVSKQKYDPKSKKLTAEMTGGGTFIVISQENVPDSNNVPKSSTQSVTPPAIFYIPHQDDETLSMGVAITQHVDAGREVIAVLYTDGAGSVAQKYLNGESYSGWWGGTHNPTREGYGHVDNQRFTQARTNELKSALMQMGVKPENINIRLLNTDGTLTLDELKQLIMEYATKYPGASHKAMSQHDSSLSHALSGQALIDLYNQQIIQDARLYISRYDFTRTLPGSLVTPTTTQAFHIKKAASVYQAWNPIVDAFAIGYHSVYTQFNAMLAKIQNKQHLPTQ